MSNLTRILFKNPIVLPIARRPKLARGLAVGLLALLALLVFGLVWTLVDNDVGGELVPHYDSYPENGTYLIENSTIEYTRDLPIELDTLWVSQSYLTFLLNTALGDLIKGQITDTIAGFGEEVDLDKQTVAMLDMLITNPSETDDMTFVMNGANSQFVLHGEDDHTATTKTWVESPEATRDVGDLQFLPFQDFFDRGGAAFFAGVDITEDLQVYGRNTETGEFFESPLTLAPGESKRVWLAYFLPLETRHFTLAYTDAAGDTHQIPLIRCCQE